MSQRLLNTVFDWDEFSVYLSGPMEFSNDSTSWRDLWTKELISIGLKSSQIYNPCIKPLKGAPFNLDEESAMCRSFRDKKDWYGLENIMSQIMHVDLRLVDKSDLILVNMPKIKFSAKDYMKMCEKRYSEFFHDVFNRNYEKYHNNVFHDLCQMFAPMRVPSYGTIHEIVIASQQHKPIMMVWEEDGLDTCSSWLMKLIGHQNIFTNINELILRLKNISSGQTAFDANDWLLIGSSKESV